MTVKLLALDLDGTLVADLNSISPRVKTAVSMAMNHGVRVVLATGREFAITRKYARQLNITTPLICYQGALIQSPQEKNPLLTHTIPADLSRRVIKFAREKKLHLILYTAHQPYTELPSPLMRQTFIRAKSDFVVVNSLLNTLHDDGLPLKFLFIQPQEEREAVEKMLNAEFGAALHITSSLNIIVEGIMPHVSKGDALKYLAAHFDVPLSQTMAIGDHDNDISLLRTAGLGVAMGNASHGAKAVADVIAPPLAEDGAAWAIERYVLNGHHG